MRNTMFCLYARTLAMKVMGLAFTLILMLSPVLLKAQLPIQTLPAPRLPSVQQTQDSLLIRQQARDSTRKARLADTSVASLISRIEELTLIVNEANGILKRGFDSSDISDNLPDIEAQVDAIREEMSGANGKLNLRNMHLSKVTLVQLEKKLKQWQGQLFSYTNKLVNISERLNDRQADSVLRNIPNDSTLRMIYLSQLKTLGRKWRSADSTNRKSLVAIGILQNHVANRYLMVTDMISELDFEIRQFDKTLFLKEYGTVWDGMGTGIPGTFQESMSRSVDSNAKVMKYYLSANSPARVLSALITFLLIAWFVSLVTHVKNVSDNPDALLAQCRYLYPLPALSALMLGQTIVPYVHAHPPAAFVESVTAMSLLWLTLIVRRRWSAKFMAHWYTAFALFILFATLNLLVAPSVAERWVLLGLSAFSIYFGWLLLSLDMSGFQKYHKVMRRIMYLYIGLNIGSLLGNVFGRLTLSKVLSITAISSLVQGVLILVCIEVIMEAFFLQVEKDKKVNGLTAHLDAILVKDRLRNVMLAGGVVLWLVKLLFNLNLFDYIYDFVVDFLTKPRTLGDIGFSYSSIAIFLLVIWISSILSRFIGYLIEGRKELEPGKKGNRLGSGMLLIRIGVLTLGILVAFTASGIPMDKLAIIIGALGVGIGFGLNTIVNNLVSGIILAFEKPIQIGDIIEVGTRQGVVKEIGIRSSKISTFDGSDVIVPNGDLLSQQLVNWTHNNHNRRVEVIVGVAYGTDLERARAIVAGTLKDKEGIQSHPAPQVLVHQLSSSSVDLRVLFWAADIDSWIDLKSRVISDIYAAFNREGIRIPFPQTDLHIRSVDLEMAAGLKGDKGKPPA
jgi:potassium efflux system protein